MQKKICFITGGNSGIGFAAAKLFAKNGYIVIIGCRNHERGVVAVKEITASSGNNEVSFIEIDMSSQESIRLASKKLHDSYKAIDILIHNAADFDISRKSPIYSVDGVELVWATNHIGPVLLTRLVLDLIKQSPQGRIITISSQGLMLYQKLEINHNDPEYRNSTFSVEKAYYQSKLAQVMYTYYLSEYLKDSNITINCIRVTNVKIDISRYPNISGFMKWLYSIKSKFSITPEKMAETYFYVATSPELIGVTGKYYDENNKFVKSSSYSYNKDELEKLIETTERFIK